MEMELVSSSGSECTVRTLDNDNTLAHRGSVTERTVPKGDVFGGWPVMTFVKVLPLRLVEEKVRSMWPDIVSSFGFFIDGRPADSAFLERGLPSLLSESDVVAQINGERCTFIDTRRVV